MIPVEMMATFFAASVLLALAPGPDNIFVLTQSALGGKRAGMVVTLGLCTGLIGHSAAVALGVAVIFKTSAAAFFALKFIGVGYLAYLAWGAFLASGEIIEAGPSRKSVSHWKLYARGVLMNIANPKVAIFFLAFLPQFTDPSKGAVWLQILILGGLFILATLAVFFGISFLAGALGQWLNRSARAHKMLNRGAGVVLLGLALTLAVAGR